MYINFVQGLSFAIAVLGPRGIDVSSRLSILDERGFRVDGRRYSFLYFRSLSLSVVLQFNEKGINLGEKKIRGTETEERLLS